MKRVISRGLPAAIAAARVAPTIKVVKLGTTSRTG
jgi:hypothetical protein